MRTEWLEYFSDAARLGSIKAAADLHCISPQGLGKAIRSLEAELHVALFRRTANRIQLTPEGTRLLPIARKAAKSLAELRVQAARIAGDDASAPLLVLCSTFVFLCGMMEPLRKGMASLRREATYLQIGTERMVETLLGAPNPMGEGKALCGVPLFFSPLRERNAADIARLEAAGYSYVPLIEYEDGMLVSRQHPLAGRRDVTRDELGRYPLVSSNVELLGPLTSYLGSGRISLATASLQTRLEIIQDGRSITFLPPFSNAARDGRFSFITLAEPYRAQVGFFHDAKRLPQEQAARLLDSLAAPYRALQEQGLCTVVFNDA